MKPWRNARFGDSVYEYRGAPKEFLGAQEVDLGAFDRSAVSDLSALADLHASAVPAACA